MCTLAPGPPLIRTVAGGWQPVPSGLARLGQKAPRGHPAACLWASAAWIQEQWLDLGPWKGRMAPSESFFQRKTRQKAPSFPRQEPAGLGPRPASVTVQSVNLEARAEGRRSDLSRSTQAGGPHGLAQATALLSPPLGRRVPEYTHPWLRELCAHPSRFDGLWCPQSGTLGGGCRSACRSRVAAVSQPGRVSRPRTCAHTPLGWRSAALPGPYLQRKPGLQGPRPIQPHGRQEAVSASAGPGLAQTQGRRRDDSFRISQWGCSLHREEGQGHLHQRKVRASRRLRPEGTLPLWDLWKEDVLPAGGESVLRSLKGENWRPLWLVERHGREGGPSPLPNLCPEPTPPGGPQTTCVQCSVRRGGQSREGRDCRDTRPGLGERQVGAWEGNKWGGEGACVPIGTPRRLRLKGRALFCRERELPRTVALLFFVLIQAPRVPLPPRWFQAALGL